MKQNDIKTTNNNCRGSVFVESSLGIVVFLTLVFGTIDLMRYGFAWLTVQNALNVGSRYATMMVTSHDIAPELDIINGGITAWSPSLPLVAVSEAAPTSATVSTNTRADLIRRKIISSSTVKILEKNISICDTGLSSCSGNDVGGPGSTLKISVRTTFNGIAGSWLPIQASVIVKNEPYSQ